MNYQTTQEATQYIYETIQKVDPNAEILDKDNIIGILQEEILDKLELEMTPEDIETLDKNKEDENFFDTYLKAKYSDYQNILTDIVNDILGWYILNE